MNDPIIKKHVHIRPHSLQTHCGRLALFVKSCLHNCEAGVGSPMPVVPLSKEPATQLTTFMTDYVRNRPR